MKPTYAKIKARGIIYWINEIRVGIAVKHATQYSQVMSHSILSQYADFVVDSNTDAILKCRSSIEDMVDNTTF